MLPSSSEAKDALRESFLSRLTPGTVEQLLRDSVPLTIPAGSVLYPEHGEAQAGLVVSGLLRVYIVSAQGRQVTVRYVRQGDVLGIAQDLAEAVGSVREVVARVLGDLRAEHLIASTRAGVRIVDPAGLHEVART